MYFSVTVNHRNSISTENKTRIDGLARLDFQKPLCFEVKFKIRKSVEILMGMFYIFNARKVILFYRMKYKGTLFR